MPDEVAFLRTILERSGDDGPRLVYADWLEEQGETARAEFIRVQIELVHLEAANPRRAALVERERELLAQHERKWIADLGDWVREWRFERGLLDYVRVPAAAFVRHGAVLFERAAVRQVRLNDATAHLRAVAKSPALRWLQALDLGYNILTAARLQPLLDAPVANHLQYLDLGVNRLGDFGAAALADTPHLARLSTLRLPANALSGSGAAALTAGGWPALKELDLDHNALGPEGMAALASSPIARRLRKLTVNANGIGNVGAHALAESSNLTHLTVLHLANNQIGDAGAIALARAPILSALEELNLASNAIESSGARAIAESRHLADLRRLNLAGNRLSRADVRLLQRRFGDRVLCGSADRNK